MKATDLALICLTCILALTFRTALCDNNTTSAADAPILPSENLKLNCSGLNNCTDDSCTYIRGDFANKTQRFFPNQVENLKCDKLSVTLLYNESIDSSFLGNENFSCIIYKNSLNLTFTVMEGSRDKTNKADNSSWSSCTYDNKNCTMKNTDAEFRFAAGIPSACSAYVEPPTTPAPTTTPVPTTASPTTTPNATTTTDPKDSNTTTSVPQTKDNSTAKPADGSDGKKDASGADQIHLTTAMGLAAMVVSLLAGL